MATTKASLKLTHEGALKALAGAVAKAEALGVPQNIAIVDDGGNLLAFVRMDAVARNLDVEGGHCGLASAADIAA
jgi:uncharacterized protein GlcG (DUF336 family)